MLNIYLLRHGETAMNANGNRYCGRTDISLTEKGIRQAEVVRDQLKDIEFDGVFCSPLIRAVNTAEIACGGREVIRDKRLIEVDFGKWEGKTRTEFIDENPVIWNQWCADPTHIRAGETGETALEVVERVSSFFKEVHLSYPSGSNIMIVGHNGLNRLYIASKLGMKLKHYRRISQENSSITRFSLDDADEIVLELLNCRGLVG